MSEGQDGIGGPLGELLRFDEAPAPVSPVHRRLLEVPEAEGTAMVIAGWSDPGGLERLHAELRRRVEAALLSELSRTAADLVSFERRITRLRFVLFPTLDWAPEAALRPFGFAPVDPGAKDLRETLAHLRGEAQRVGADVPDVPAQVWDAPTAMPEGAAGEWMTEVESELVRRTGDECWGQRPGVPFGRLAALLEERGEESLEPDSEALDALEARLVQRISGPIRWIPPMLFQSLCDMVAAIAVKEHGAEVQWAECAPDEGGLAPPPVIRAKGKGDWVHIPIGMHLLRWCVMPVAEGESVPSIASWARDQFGET